jgi:histidyl-tRNA synthetase
LDKAQSFENIPTMELNTQDMKEFYSLQQMLKDNNVAFQHNPYLVRGLDYYNSTVFEFKVNNQAVLAGGRYDHLMEQLGGKYTPATGFGAGVDRIINNISYNYVNKKIGIISLNQNEYAQQIAQKLRFGQKLIIENKPIDLDFEGVIVFWLLDLKKALYQANKEGYRYIIICGDDEAKAGTFILKDLNDSSQKIAKIL